MAGALDVDVGLSGDAVGSSVGVTAVGPEGSGAIDVAPEAVGSASDALGMGEADTIGGGVRGEMLGDAEPSGDGRSGIRWHGRRRGVPGRNHDRAEEDHRVETTHDASLMDE